MTNEELIALKQQVDDLVACSITPACTITTPTGRISGLEYHELTRLDNRFIRYREQILNCIRFDKTTHTALCTNVVDDGTVLYGKFMPTYEKHRVSIDNIYVRDGLNHLETGDVLEHGKTYDVSVPYVTGSTGTPSITINGKTYSNTEEYETVIVYDTDVEITGVSGPVGVLVKLVYYQGADYEIASKSIPTYDLDGTVLNVTV